MTRAEMAAAIRKKHPGAYDGRSDDELVSAWVKKFPVYEKQISDEPVTVTPPKQTLGNPGGNIPIAGIQPKGTFDTTEEDTTAGKVAQSLSLASVDPMTGLGAPVDAMGAGARTTAKVISKIPFRSIASGTANAGATALDIPAAILDNPVAGMFSPRLRNLGELIGRSADSLRGVSKYIKGGPSVLSEVGTLIKSPKPAGTIEDQLDNILREGMAEEARPVSVEIPPSPRMTPDGVPSRPSGGPVNPHTTAPGPARPAPAQNAYSSGSARDANMQGPAPRAGKVEAPAPPPEVGTLTGKKASDPMVDMLNSMMSEQGAAPKSVELPPQPDMTATGRPALRTGEYAPTDPALVEASQQSAMAKYAPEPPAPAEVGTLTGRTAPSTEDELSKVLTDMLAPQGPAVTELPPVAGSTPGGSFRQSGQFGKSGRLGQAGGYSSGNPAVGDMSPMEGWAGTTTEGVDVPTNAYSPDAPKPYNDPRPPRSYSSGDVADPAMNAGPEDMGFGNDLPLPDDSGAGAAIESPVTSLTADPVAAPAADAPRVTPEMAQQARSFLGSRDGARALGITEQQLKELAPGPSRTPGVVDSVKAGGNRGELTAAFLKELGIGE